jgi:hypothetical protein
MNLHLQLPPDSASNQPHPALHRAAAALFIWFVAAAWLLFSGSGYIDLALAMISVLVAMMIAIPMALWRAWRANARSLVAGSSASNEGREAENEGREAEEDQPLRVWLRGEVATHSGPEKSSAAAVEILLPIAAVALGITALGIVFDLVRAGAI